MNRVNYKPFLKNINIKLFSQGFFLIFIPLPAIINGNMYERLQTVIGYLVSKRDNEEPVSGINIDEFFQPHEENDRFLIRNINAAFLLCLSGKKHKRYDEAREYLKKMESHPSFGAVASFFVKGLSRIQEEISSTCSKGSPGEKRLNELYSCLTGDISCAERSDILDRIYSFFFPEGVSILKHKREMIEALRRKRTIHISRLNPNPIKNPFNEILFTSNILLTIPPKTRGIETLPLKESVRGRLKEIVKEDQLYWYDHPIQIGTDRESNEILYGLKELERTVHFEVHRASMPENTKCTCVLSVSTTHNGLHHIIKDYLEDEVKSSADIPHLNVFVLTEEETERLNNDVLIPAAKKYLSPKEPSILREIIGVDGEYGRHFSFLKAVAAFWKVLIDPRVKGTFKIDLDQAFPQKELVEETGLSALEHFQNPLWGASGIDYWGNRVELGMIAGALVNERDIKRSLFTPDVTFPQDEIAGDEWVFFSRLPQALSTQAEMMTRYRENLDGKERCIQRIHVTGGTSGILIKSLREYRPFTPSFIGRAEDQAYIMAALFNHVDHSLLRYVHKEGLIMRHDKEAFAKEAMKTAKVGKIIGDYKRILWFSYYARALPWSLDQIKEMLDPFTGCFISSIPFTIVYLRLALKAVSLFAEESFERSNEGLELLMTGTKQLENVISYLEEEPNPLAERYQREKQAWNLYYDILDRVEKELQRKDPFALKLKKRAKELVSECKIRGVRNKN